MFREQIAAELTAQLAGRPLDAALDTWLNAEHGATSATYARLKAKLPSRRGRRAGCATAKAAASATAASSSPRRRLHGFSVDVVDMQDIAGPHHTHPNGEIDLIMPLDGEAQFSTAAPPAGWSAHPAAPTGPP
jgi:hypothetical protein